MGNEEIDAVDEKIVAHPLVIVGGGVVSAGAVRLAEGAFLFELVRRGADLDHLELVELRWVVPQMIAEQQVETRPLAVHIGVAILPPWAWGH